MIPNIQVTAWDLIGLHAHESGPIGLLNGKVSHLLCSILVTWGMDGYMGGWEDGWTRARPPVTLVAK
jgi:hypothetical protein